MKRKFTLETTSTSLHLMAMAIMLVDHCKRIFPDVGLLVCIGRIAFPIFAFLIVEGYHHTRDLKKYVQRLLFFALLAEIPTDLMRSGMPFNASHQNVLWTFLIGLALIHINEKAKQSGKRGLCILATVGTVTAGYYIGMLTHVDYSGGGVLTVLTFYFFRGRCWKSFLLQLASMVYLNFAVLSGQILEFTLLEQSISFSRQGFAVLALIPIWLYRGRQGYHSKWLQYLNYAFYPGHMLVIAVIIGAVSPAALLALPAAAAVVLVWRLIGEKGQAGVKRVLGCPAFSVATVAAAILLLVAAPRLYISNLSTDQVDVDRINIFYYADGPSYQSGTPTEMLSVTDSEEIETWIAFRDEAAPEEKRTNFNGYSSYFPCYAIWYIKGSTVLEGMFVTQRETVLYDQNFSTSGYVGYIPLNPYFEQVSEMMGVPEN